MNIKKLNAMQRLQEALLLAVILCSLYSAVALFSVDEQDPSWLYAVPATTIHNHAGPLGAWLAATLLFIFGVFAYLLPILGVIWPLMRWWYQPLERQPVHPLLRVLHLVGISLLLLTTCSLLTITLEHPAGYLPAGAGGVIGSLLIQGVLPWCSRLGTLLILVCGWAIGLTLLTGCSWLTLLPRVAKKIKAFIYGLLGWLFGGKEWFLKCYVLLKPVRSSATVMIQTVSPTQTMVRLQAEESGTTSERQEPELDDRYPETTLEVVSDRTSAVCVDKALKPIHGNSRNRIESLKWQQHPIDQIEKTGRLLPDLALLNLADRQPTELPQAELQKMAKMIEERLADYRVAAEVVGISPGPVITRYELSLAPGIKAARISTLARDLARALSVVAVRVVEVIPGKPYVGLELPNQQRQTVYLREVLSSELFQKAHSPLTIVLGKDIAGCPLIADLAKMPHVLVAGTTGSGKSVGVNAMILSLLYKATPDEVRFIMIDPKMLELSVYEGIPHLLTEVVTDMNDAAKALRWCVNEMEQRYKLMSLLGVRNIAGYNQQIRQAIERGEPLLDPLWCQETSLAEAAPSLSHLPYIVVIVDEFADLMLTVGKKVEELIARLAQKARAAGIHLVLATQRPSVDVITGLIKANIPSRIAFTVSSKIDSRTILDQMGAESLLGMGDMLYLPANASLPIRVHGAFVQDQEVHVVVNDWKARGQPQYIDTILADSDSYGDEGGITLSGVTGSGLDPLFDQAVSFVAESRRGSISSVQRKFKIGYNRAARLIEQMETEGIVSAPGHNGNREVRVLPSRREFSE